MTTKPTGPTRRWHAMLDRGDRVLSRRELGVVGVSRFEVAAHVRAGRWQRVGGAILLHNGVPTRSDLEQVALIDCGPRSVLTSFTGLARWGLTGWHRDVIHVFAPPGTRKPDVPMLVLHRAAVWRPEEIVQVRRLHRPAHAAMLAASSTSSPRVAVGVLAACVQQRLVRNEALHSALERLPKLRHHRAIALALNDIDQGAHALSEIDFVSLCRRHGLPLPRRQTVRVEANGRRRYLDAEWELPGGRSFAVEIDGAIHLVPMTWFADQIRQNEVVLTGTPVLRYPSVVVREEEQIVVAQLRRGLLR